MAVVAARQIGSLCRGRRMVMRRRRAAMAIVGAFALAWGVLTVTLAGLAWPAPAAAQSFTYNPRPPHPPARTTAVAAVKYGAIDYLPKPADADDILAALMAVPGTKPKPPENPMSADRVRWEHIQRVYELCGHNVSETARRLNMHRRTLQRILAKRSPR